MPALPVLPITETISSSQNARVNGSLVDFRWKSRFRVTLDRPVTSRERY